MTNFRLKLEHTPYTTGTRIYENSKPNQGHHQQHPKREKVLLVPKAKGKARLKPIREEVVELIKPAKTHLSYLRFKQ
jgi:hypothetical protein